MCRTAAGVDLLNLFRAVVFVSLLFIFSGSLPSRDLHSFPTRRSSDLLRQTLAHMRHGGGGSIAVDRNAHQFRDRKSTRLNSSHRCISYAVFCLKKKIDLRVWVLRPAWETKMYGFFIDLIHS